VLFTRLLDARPRLPSLCAVCHGWGQQRVCADCIERFAAWPARCERCALRVPDDVRLCGACVTDPPPFARTLAAVDYDHPWDALITHFKFHGALDLAPALTYRLLEAFERRSPCAVAAAGTGTGAGAAERRAHARARRYSVRGRHVTIVDDVMTTAATATASGLVRVLLRAGAAQVSVRVVARTPRHDEP